MVIPAVDVLDGKVVRLTKGDYDAVTVYAADPVAMARTWVEAGADRVHVVDLEGARSGRPERGLWSTMAAAGIPFQVGGGIRDRETAVAAAASGAEAVVLGTAAVWEPDLLGGLIDELGSSRVVAAVDVRDGKATGAGWLDAGRELEAVVVSLRQAGVEWFLVTGIDRDGTLEGPDLGLASAVRRLGAPRIMVSGGIGSLDDLSAARDAGADAVIVGRALYAGRFSLAEARAVAAAPGAAPPAG